MRPRRSLTPVAVALAAVAIALAGCGGDGGNKKSNRAQAYSGAAAGDRGDFKVAFDSPQSEDERAVEQVLRDPNGADVEGLASGLNEALSLPHDITIKIDHGDPSPYFDPERKEIHLQYDFVLYGDQVYTDLYPDDSPEESLNRDASLVDFVLMHEIGHSLIDAYDIPVLGKEEDAVDALATVMMTQFVDGGDDIAVAGADFFGALAGQKGTNFSDSDFWDEHSLDKQRAYAIICWVAGSSDEDLKAVADARLIGEDRLQSCPDEYQQKVRSWFRVLEPHIKA